MVRIVDEELKKLPDHLKQQVEKIIKTVEHPPEKGNPSPPKEDSPLKVGDLVKNKSGEFGKVTAVYPNGDVDIEPVADPTGKVS
jgi:hypothetical protein